MLTIFTERFFLRELVPEDANETYLGWLNDSAIQRFITSANKTHTQAELSAYVCSRLNRDDVLFLGIFEKQSGKHIGNIKFEPIDTIESYAVLGMLIGDESWRGKGVAGEVIDASIDTICVQRGVKEIILGVELDNKSAIRAYEKVGFQIEPTNRISVDPSSATTMVRRKASA